MTLASVVIPTRNRAALLDSCLESLTGQTLSPEKFEVIVVDNGSEDSTARVVSRYVTQLNVRRIEAPIPGLHEGRHAGLRDARSDVLVFADDDIEAIPTWIETIVDAFEDPKIAMVGGNCWPLFETAPPDWLRRWWSEPVYRGRALGYLSILDFGEGAFLIDPVYVWGCNFSIRRLALEVAGGFHPDGLPMEMIRFRGDGETHVARHVRSLGWQAVFDSGASVYHRVSAARMTKGYFESRAFAQGVSDSYTAVRLRRGPSSGWHGPAAANLRRTLREWRERWRAHATVGDAVTNQLLDVRLATVQAWYRGFKWHQEAVRADQSLLRWVLRESYLA